MDLLRTGWSTPPVAERVPQRPPYRRVQAPIVHRPTSWFAQGLPRESREPGLGGIRSYSDEPVKAGRLLEMDVFLADGATVTALVEVEWCDPLPPGAPARFEVGMRWVHVARSDLERLGPVLGRP
jgi:hypothetical protein